MLPGSNGRVLIQVLSSGAEDFCIPHIQGILQLGCCSFIDCVARFNMPHWNESVILPRHGAIFHLVL
jgi:hypothetical protein